MMGKDHEEMQRATKVQRFKGKKGGVIPPKRKLVKRMILDSIVKFFVSHFKHSSSTSMKSTTRS